MHSNEHRNARRQFLKKIAATSIGSTVTSMGAMNESLAQLSPNDYKSLVCIFLFGGNDQWNTLIPTTNQRYDRYAEIRADLALPQSSLLQLDDYSLHPSLQNTRNLYGLGKLAFVRNIGNLVTPTTQADYFAQSVTVPKDLFSHNHQQELWQTNQAPVSGKSFAGWGGRMADIFSQQNDSETLSPSFTLFGNNYWQAGTNEFTQQPFDISPGGVGIFNHLNYDSWPQQEMMRSESWESILQLPRENLLEAQVATMLLSTRTRLGAIRKTLDGVGEFSAVFEQNNTLAMQLRMVAKLIATREQLGLKRQIFMVGLGGFDTHGAQLVTHRNKLSELDGALSSFYEATRELGVSQSVLTFTASEFGRTLTVNGDGTDHAWSSDYIVMGDAVLGGRTYGNEVALFQDNELITRTETGENIYGPNDVGSGRFIPEYSVEQYGATVARWMGLNDEQLDNVFPGLKNFSIRDLGFMG